jgi:hypothetical protein
MKNCMNQSQYWLVLLINMCMKILYDNFLRFLMIGSTFKGTNLLMLTINFLIQLLILFFKLLYMFLLFLIACFIDLQCFLNLIVFAVDDVIFLRLQRLHLE